MVDLWRDFWVYETERVNKWPNFMKDYDDDDDDDFDYDK